MSRTIRNEKRKERLVRLEDECTYWYGEGLQGKWLKKLKREEHKHNRRVGKRAITSEGDTYGT